MNNSKNTKKNEKPVKTPIFPMRLINKRLIRKKGDSFKRTLCQFENNL